MSLGREVLEQFQKEDRVKRYELLKDTPDIKKGAIFYSDDGIYYKNKCGNLVASYRSDIVENNPEWFREVSGRWRPKLGEQYFRVTLDCGKIGETCLTRREEGDEYYGENCFQTRKDAEEAADLVKKTLLEFHETLAARDKR